MKNIIILLLFRTEIRRQKTQDLPIRISTVTHHGKSHDSEKKHTDYIK